MLTWTQKYKESAPAPGVHSHPKAVPPPPPRGSVPHPDTCAFIGVGRSYLSSREAWKIMDQGCGWVGTAYAGRWSVEPLSMGTL